MGQLLDIVNKNSQSKVHKRRNFIQVNSSQSRETHPLVETKIVLHQDKKKTAFIEKVPTQSIFMQMRFTNHTVLIGQNYAGLIAQFRCKWEYNCAVLIGPGRSQSIGQNMKPETSL